MKIQIDDVVETATAEQIALVEAIQSAPSFEERAKTTADSKAAVLAKLGLTEEEAAVLLG
jgi:protein-disulfide isomerase-like protein with CxxC motif